ncbi:MAG: recombinase family protein [Phycisphaeraceae bacterium]|nr:recombinase family protein [Phycisphaeraceae bacterium]
MPQAAVSPKRFQEGITSAGDQPRFAVGYLRRSTDRQEQSIPDQKKSIEQYAEQHGFKTLRFYTDDAISGTSTVGRRAFQSLMADAKSRTCDFRFVIVYDVKRFGRIDNDEAGFYRHTLRTCGIEVRYVTENFTGDRTDDLLRPVKQWQAREESKDLSKVTIRGLLSKSESGAWMGGVPPLGYDLRYQSESGNFITHVRHMPDGSKQLFDEQWKRLRSLGRGESLAVSRKDRCFLVPSEQPRQDAVREIFRLYVEENRGFKAVADALNRAGIPSPRSAAWSERMKGKWSTTTVRAILVNPVYTGDMVWNRRTDARFHRIVEGQAIQREDVYANRLEPNEESDWIVVPDSHPALVNRRIWELAKAKREQQETSKQQRGINPRTGEKAGKLEPGGSMGGWTGPKAKYLLSGLVTCAKCGNRYEGHSQYLKGFDEEGKRKRHLGYACGGYIRHGANTCQIGRIGKEQLEDLVVAVVLDFYGTYTGKNARDKIAKVFAGEMGGEVREVGKIRQRYEERLQQIEQTVRNLLDNITSDNRRAADRRLLELAGERSEIEQKLDDLKHLALSTTQAKELIEHTARFIAGLKTALIEAPLDQRQAAIRRCVDTVVIDYTAGKARLALRSLPTVAGSSTAREVEHIEANLCISPATAEQANDAPKRK